MEEESTEERQYYDCDFVLVVKEVLESNLCLTTIHPNHEDAIYSFDFLVAQQAVDRF